MKTNFVWCDLSTFDIEKTKDFYHQIFGWDFEKTSDQSSTEDYFIAYQGKTPVGAVFVMPEFLQKIHIPSFWMSYVEVPDIQKTVEKARTHEGVIIEIEPTAFDAQSQIALIRDPSGAGFTVYQGPSLDGKFPNGHGRMIWNVHHVNDVGLIQNFYEDVFGWSFKRDLDTSDVYEIYNEGKELIAHVEVLDNSIKGEKQYWMPTFGVDDLKAGQKQIQKLGGEVLWDLEDGRVMVADPQGGSFLIQQKKGVKKKQKNSLKWKTILALGIIWWAVLSETNWVWGLLFLLWVLPDLRSGQTYFVESVSRTQNPILFWVIMISWLTLSGLLLIPVFGG